MIDKKDTDTIQYDEGPGAARPLVSDVMAKTKYREIKGSSATKKAGWFQGERGWSDAGTGYQPTRL